MHTGRELWVLLISTTPSEKTILKPEVKYVGNIHGNEPVGRELLLRLIQVTHLYITYSDASIIHECQMKIIENLNRISTSISQHLLVNYPQDDYVRFLMETTNIHIMPSMNPDGFEVSREGDCGGVQGR